MSRLALLFAEIALWAVLASLLASMAFGQERHDPADQNHWYDEECCSLRDCAPVAMTLENFTVTEKGIYIELPVGAHPLLETAGTEPTFFEWGDHRIKVSQDENWHVCLSDMPSGWNGLHWIYCVYIGGVS